MEGKIDIAMIAPTIMLAQHNSHMKDKMRLNNISNGTEPVSV